MIEIDKWIISFIVFGLFITTGILIITDLKTNYNPTMNTSDFSNTYETIDEMYNISKQMKDKTVEQDISEESFASTMWRNSFLALKQLTNTFSIFDAVSKDIGAKLGIPEFFITAAFSVVIIMVIIALIYMFTRMY